MDVRHQCHWGFIAPITPERVSLQGGTRGTGQLLAVTECATLRVRRPPLRRLLGSEPGRRTLAEQRHLRCRRVRRSDEGDCQHEQGSERGGHRIAPMASVRVFSYSSILEITLEVSELGAPAAASRTM